MGGALRAMFTQSDYFEPTRYPRGQIRIAVIRYHTTRWLDMDGHGCRSVNIIPRVME